MLLTIESGKELIGLARKSIESFLEDKDLEHDDALKEKYSEKRGVFVTLYLNRQLRGCIGFPLPSYTLYDGIVNASRSAAFEDPRFPRLTAEEYQKIRIEISVLTVPQEIHADKQKPEDILDCIKIKRDGLIVENSYASGLLLPQVAVEWGWDSKQFLENTCMKAGLDKDAWKEKNCRISTFSAQIFAEKDGKVVERKIEA
mgnify:CR=1 FL=1